MRPPLLFTALLWFWGFGTEEDECRSLEGCPDEERGAPPPKVNFSSQGEPTSLFLNWAAPEPGVSGHVLRLIRLSPLGSPEGQQLRAYTDTLHFEFRDLVPGSRYQLEVTALRPCALKATIILIARTAPSTVRDLQLRSSGGPSSLEASWEASPGEHSGYQLLLYHLESQTLAHNISMSLGNLSYNFGNLLPGSEYVLEVASWAGNLQAKTSVHQWTAPTSPDHLVLYSLGTNALEASWDSSEGAAWLNLVLTDLLEGTNLTTVVRRGISNHTFLHLSPGTPYQLTLTAVAGPHRAGGPNATQWTYPSAPLDLQLTLLPQELWASWKVGPGTRDGYLLRLSGPVERNATLGPGAVNATFPGPLPTGHYALELRVLAGPHDAWAQASAWLADSAAQPGQGNGSKLQLDGLEAASEPGRRALLYAEGAPGLLGNISVPPGATQVTFCGLVPGARYRVDITSSRGVITQSLTGHTRPLAPQSLEVAGRGNPSELAIDWAPAPGQRDGYRVAWHREGSPRSLGGLVDLSRNNSSLMLRGLVPGTCYAVTVWAWMGNLTSSTQRISSCTVPAPPANLSLGLAEQPPALRASWSPPAGNRDGFQLQLYRLRPLNLEGVETLAPETQNFSWAQLPPGTEFLVQLSTLRGPDESSSTNATGWTSPLAPPLVNVTSAGPTQLRASWVHAPGGRDSYQVTLYQGGTWAGASMLGPEVDSTGFSALTPGTKYDVEIVSRAGPLRTPAASASGWTSPLAPSELLVSMQAGSAVVDLAWPSGPVGQGACHAHLSEPGHPSWEQPLVLGQAHLVLRGITPGRNLSLSVLCQAGPLQAATHPVVLPVEPGPVKDVQCQPGATRLALNWTVPAGDVSTCLVVVEQLTTGGHMHLIFQANTSGDALLLPNLVPATSYHLSLTVLGSNGLWSRAVTLVCTTAAEAWHAPEFVVAPQLELEAGMGVVITRGMFGEDDGQVQWYGVVATTNMSLARPPREAINHTWYDHYYRGCNSYLAILLPNPFYPGPRAVLRSWMVPMGTEDCGQTQEICNGRLKPGFHYRFSIAAFSRHSLPEPSVSFSAFSEPRASTSRAAVPLPGVVGIVVGCILTICSVVGLLRCRRAPGQRAEKNRFSQELTVYTPRRTHRPIPLQNFQQSYQAKSAHAQQAFFQEFEELKEVGKEQPRLEAEHPANTCKNRYPHVLPYDHSRVRLSQLEGELHSDYINANFVPGYAHPKEFIATQGPLKKTLEDFWRLVWEQQVDVIVMLTMGMENGRVLCEHYWPADSTPVAYGHITVHLLAEEPEEEWTKREFRLQHGPQQQQQRVKQLQFTTWPDHSIPEAPGSLLSFVEVVREQAGTSWGRGPILVHCSAGVGRTGTFVALLRLLQQLEEEQVVDVFNTVYALRLHRPLMIQTPSQYIFLHSCLLNKILEGPSDTSEAEKTRSRSWGTSSALSPRLPSPRSQPISVKNFGQAFAKKAANANAGFLKEYELLLQAIKDEAGSLTPPPGYEQDSTACDDRSQVQFSPLEEKAPGEMPEAWLFPGGPSGHDHVVLTGPAGPEELWELVWEHSAHVLVSLCPPNTQEKVRGAEGGRFREHSLWWGLGRDFGKLPDSARPQEFWPTETRPIIMDTMTVHWVAESSTAGWPCTLLKISRGESRKERQVQCLQFPRLEPESELPATTLLPFLAAVGQCCSQGTSKKPGTLLSHCSKAMAQLGTFLAMEQLLQQAGAECTVDVFNVALQQSQACDLMTPTLEQYIYLYDCLNSALVDGLP
ncbi:receptor-type tyrosine-protein phosphatase V-like [Choloepus didactylus]|uniref:receptor-type tyrosine-protein phosphatase V-like n=1 Tax=Choloepus didactylus TaxID=27675 RepID=UPI00189D3806|nr:receptor-type tyrosine-protein phosphatase V-like [Choloepus didactylus]